MDSPLHRFLRLGCALAGSSILAAPPDIPDPRTTGTPFLHVWSAEEHGGAPVNWHVLQHPASGYIYVANNFGVLEFDGATWRLVELPSGGRASTLAVDAGGRVWAAGDDLAVLIPHATGQLRAESQLERLPAADRAIGNLIFSASAPSFTAFANTDRVFVFPRAGAAFAVAAPARISSLWVAGDQLQVTLNNGAMLQLVDRQLTPSHLSLGPATPSGAQVWIVSEARPEGPDRWLLATNRGLVRASVGTERAEFLFTIPPALLGEMQITAAALLADGGYACASIRSGLLVFDAQGRLRRQVQREHGLPGNRIDHLFEDAEGGLWLAQRTGLTRVQLDSPYAMHGVAQGLEGGPRTLLRHGGRLFVGHNEGLAVAEPNGRFRELPGMRLGANRLVEHAGRLFVTSGSLREVLPDLSLRSLSREAFAPLIPLRRDPGLLLGGMSSGVWIDALTETGVSSRGRVDSVPGPIVHLLDRGDGFVWALNPSGRVWRIDFRAGVRADAPARAYGPDDGLPAAQRRDEPLFLELGNELLVTCARWTMRYEAASDRFVPEDRIAGLDPLQTGATDASRDENGIWWLRLGPPSRTIVRLDPIADRRWRAQPIVSAALAGLVGNGLYADLPAQTLWVAGQGALVSVALDWQPARPARPLHAVVRRLETPDGRPLLDPATGGDATLASRHHDLQIRFASPTFTPDYRGQVPTQYRSRLVGLDDDWTEWSGDATRAFTNLPYRDYVIEVQARDLAGRVSVISGFAFRLAPPWWLTTWALVGYTGLAGLGVVGIVRLRTASLRRRNEELTAAVATRTQELHRQNLELARLHQLELDEKISARLAEEKARLEVLRYQLNPHFLFNALNSVCAQIIREPVAARSMVVRLADFCRLTLHRPGNDEAAMTVAQELKLLSAYLEIEQARLGELITIEIRADAAADDVRIPPFLLLPLVENAVKYGSATSPERLALRLVIRSTGPHAIEIEVANTGRWLAPGSHTGPSHGIGLENLRQRLARYYPGAHELSQHAADGWVMIRLRLHAPLREHAHAHH